MSTDGRHGANRQPPPDRVAGDRAAFDRWLVGGLAPDDRDRVAGNVLADAWRDRRRALDGTAGQRPIASHRRRLVWWWAPAAVVALASVAVWSWPTATVVDEGALAGAYLEAMTTLPMGAP